MEQAAAAVTRPPLAGDIAVDVAIVGAGFSGLWTAYYLKILAPGLSVAVLEGKRCGFGASGRNGGWMMASLEGLVGLLAALPPGRRQRVRGLIHGILPEIEAALGRCAIQCDYRRGGGIYAAARYPQQLRLQRELLAGLRGVGMGEGDYRWLEADELRRRLLIHRPLGAIYTPHIARIQPARLVLGLVAALDGMGVQVYEHSPVIDLAGAELVTPQGRVRAQRRVLALEGYSGRLAPVAGRVLAVQSHIVATEPLDEATWAGIGLAEREVFCDASPLVTYGQRSADNRLVFGARGSYRFGGRPRSGFAAGDACFRRVEALMRDCFPQLAGVPVSHRWGGTLGVPRSGLPYAVYDPATATGSCGGYCGEGVGASNLMARTLVDLMLERDTELADAPWAGRGPLAARLRRWEPEPLRWLGYKSADLARSVEEAVYRRDPGAWLEAPVRGFSRWLDGFRR